jgi:hypothetical protein
MHEAAWDRDQRMDVCPSQVRSMAYSDRNTAEPSV